MEYTSKSIIFWLYGCLAGVAGMVLLGGLTRLSDSGLSITEWQPFTGAFPPLSESSWLEYFAKYQQIPEYHQIYASISLAEFKELFWLEYLHRLLGRVVGIVVLVPFLFFWAKNMFSKETREKMLVVLVLFGLQGFFGWYMVQSGLSERTDVSQYRLALHLLTAFVIYSLLLNLLLKLRNPQLRDEPSALAPFSRVIIAMIFFMVLLGAFVAGTDAGFIYTDFPNMGDGFVPSDVYALSPWWHNHLENQATIQFQHRVFAVFLTLAIGIFSYFYIKYDLVGRKLGWLLLGALALQIALGVGTLHMFAGLEEYFAANGYKKIFQPAVIVAELHQLGALLLLTVSIIITHQLTHKERL